MRHRAVEPRDDAGPVYGGRPGPAQVAAVLNEVGMSNAAAEAMSALYETAGIRVRPGGLDPRWGCAISAHEELGWCCSCPGISMAAEVGAWRIRAAGHPPPDVAWARAVSAAA